MKRIKLLALAIITMGVVGSCATQAPNSVINNQVAETIQSTEANTGKDMSFSVKGPLSDQTCALGQTKGEDDIGRYNCSNFSRAKNYTCKFKPGFFEYWFGGMPACKK